MEKWYTYTFQRYGPSSHFRYSIYFQYKDTSTKKGHNAQKCMYIPYQSQRKVNITYKYGFIRYGCILVGL